VGDTTLALESSDPVQLPELDAKMLEEAPPVTEQDRHEGDLELVEHACGQGTLRDPGPVDQHLLVAGSRPRRHELVVDLAVHAVQPRSSCLMVVAPTRKDSLVQSLAAVTETVVRALVGAGDEAVEGHRHVQHGRGHRFTPCLRVERQKLSPTLE
jgi:hypothetical protein